MILYPRLVRTDALIERAAELSSLSVAECRKRRSTTDPSAVFSAVGGVQATAKRLQDIADALTGIAKEHGLDEDREQRRNTSADAEWGAWLHRHLDVSPHEAAGDAMWHFFTVVLVPDLVRWRWGAAKEESTSDRWVTVKHRGRNAFGRLWWRCEVLKDPDADDPYWLTRQLGEDELVQIMERPSFAGHRLLSRTTVARLLDLQLPAGVSRGDVLREYQMRMLRLGAFTEFQALDAEALRALADETLPKAVIGAQERGKRKKERKKKA